MFDLTKDYYLKDKKLKKVADFFQLIGTLDCEKIGLISLKEDFILTSKNTYFIGPYNKILQGIYLKKNNQSYFCKIKMVLEGIYKNEDEMEELRYKELVKKIEDCFNKNNH